MHRIITQSGIVWRTFMYYRMFALCVYVGCTYVCAFGSARHLRSGCINQSCDCFALSFFSDLITRFCSMPYWLYFSSLGLFACAFSSHGCLPRWFSACLTEVCSGVFFLHYSALLGFCALWMKLACVLCFVGLNEKKERIQHWSWTPFLKSGKNEENTIPFTWVGSSEITNTTKSDTIKSLDYNF